MDSEKEKLIYKRAKAKHDVDLELKNMTPLNKISPEDAKHAASMVNNSMERV